MKTIETVPPSEFGVGPGAPVCRGSHSNAYTKGVPAIIPLRN